MRLLNAFRDFAEPPILKGITVEIAVEQEITITIGEFQQKLTLEECRYLRDRLNEIMGQSPKTLSARNPLDQTSLRKAYEEAMAEKREVVINSQPMRPSVIETPAWTSKEYVPIQEKRWTPPEAMKVDEIF